MKHLSKSDYIKYKIHPAYLWYQKNQPRKLPAVDDNQRYTFAQGFEFEELATGLIDGAVEIEGESWEFEKLASDTQQAISAGARTLLQAGFMTDDRLFCRSDVVNRLDDGSWQLIEIKSSTSVKQRHLYDLAFQSLVMARLGHEVSNVQVMHVNRNYVRDGDINPERLVAIRDVTDEVLALHAEVERDVEQAQSVIEQAEIDDHPAYAGDLNAWMSVYRHLHPELAEDSVLNLIQLKPQLVREAYHAGIESMTELDTQQLTVKQTAQVTAWKQDELLVAADNIRDFLQSLAYPLYFLDYETSAHVIPLYDGTKPYQQVPFQYSLHKLASPDAQLEHFEYLHTDDDLPVGALASKLVTEIGQQGTVLAWFHKFEMYCNRTMGKLEPEFEEQMAQLNKRMVDLRVPFARQDYVDKRFQGSSSIKNVLPVMVPELSYKELGIQEGGAAQRLWQQVRDGSRGDDAEQVYADLLEYCKLDTLAMVEIYRKLRIAAGLDKQLIQANIFDS